MENGKNAESDSDDNGRVSLYDAQTADLARGLWFELHCCRLTGLRVIARTLRMELEHGGGFEVVLVTYLLLIMSTYYPFGRKTQ